MFLERVDEATEPILIEPFVGRLLGLRVESVGPHDGYDGISVGVDETARSSSVQEVSS